MFSSSHFPLLVSAARSSSDTWTWGSLFAVLGLLCCAAAQAAHPLGTEDTATLGVGGLEIEWGALVSREGQDRVRSVQSQLTLGLLPTLDALVQATWLSQELPGQQPLHGLGDSTIDMKWRFYNEGDLSLALRAGFNFATADKVFGQSADRFSPRVLLAASYEAPGWSLHANLGYVRNPILQGQRRDLGHVSVALVRSLTPALQLVLEAMADSHSDPAHASWQSAVLGGLIYSLRPGLDLDLGYQNSVRRQQPLQQWLLGLTYRWDSP